MFKLQFVLHPYIIMRITNSFLASAHQISQMWVIILDHHLAHWISQFIFDLNSTYNFYNFDPTREEKWFIKYGFTLIPILMLWSYFPIRFVSPYYDLLSIPTFEIRRVEIRLLGKLIHFKSLNLPLWAYIC